MSKDADIPADQPDDLGPLAASTIGPPSGGETDLPPLQAASAPPGRRFPFAVIGAVAAAGIVGVTVGLALAPAMRTSVASAPDQMQVLVETKPTPTPSIGPPMPTLQGLPPPAAPAPRVQTAPPAETPSPAPAARPVAAQVATPPVTHTDPADLACAYAASDPASGCADQDIVAIDRELYAAYQAARRVGVPNDELREDQQDWRVASAAAVDESRAALLDAYRGRVRQVWAMVEEWDDQDRYDDRRFGRSRLR